MRVPGKSMDDGSDQSMDDILASIRRIISEEPLATRPVPGALHDGPPGTAHPTTQRVPMKRAIEADLPEAKRDFVARVSERADAPNDLDDDLFEPAHTLQDAVSQPDYVSPRAPRELIFKPTSNLVDETAPVVVEPVAIDVSDAVTPKPSEHAITEALAEIMADVPEFADAAATDATDAPQSDAPSSITLVEVVDEVPDAVVSAVAPDAVDPPHDARACGPFIVLGCGCAARG